MHGCARHVKASKAIEYDVDYVLMPGMILYPKSLQLFGIMPQDRGMIASQGLAAFCAAWRTASGWSEAYLSR